MKRFSYSQMAAVAAVTLATGVCLGKGCFQPKAEGPIAAESCRISTAADDSARFVELVARRAVRQTAPMLRYELGAGESGEAEIFYQVSINEQGKLRLISSYVSCEGAPCPGESELPEMIGILLAGEWALGPREAPCLLEIGVRVPPLRKGEQHSEPIDLQRGIEL